jgi:hypothetical protein
MKLVAIALLVAGSAALAQRPNPNPAGFGSVLYPGTGGPPPPRVPNGGFGSVLYPGTGGPPGHGVIPRRIIAPPALVHPSHQRSIIVPVPVYYGGYYYDPSGGGYAQQPAPAYEDPNSYTQSPVVILNQGFRSAPPEQPSEPQPYVDQTNYRPDAPPTIYLIAMTDHTILATIAYWVEGDTLSYITVEGNQNRVSMALVDREFSKKLNDDRQVEFRLPKQ